MANLATAELVPQGNELKNPGDSPVIINEYGWLWLNRDGTPTTLTEKLYANLLGTNSTTAERRHLYARYLAAETEFWRSHRQAAAVMHFTSLGYSRATGQTSDHWLNVAKLEWEPEFYKYVRDAFAPVGLMIDDWNESYEAGKTHEVPVVLINDLDKTWRGTVQVRLLRSGKAVQEQKLKTLILGFGQTKLNFTMSMPTECGPYQVEATLRGSSSGEVKCFRDFTVVWR